MNAQKLYQHLEKDFIKPHFTDEWYQIITTENQEYITEQFKKRNMGLVCDFAEDINKVFTAVFASEESMKKLIDMNVTDAMLFVHHPAGWDLTHESIFIPMSKELLQEFKQRRISIYNLHVPLDDEGPYSTSVTLAKTLGITPYKSFGPYHGALAGVFGTTNNSLIQLRERYSEEVGHETSLYSYGSEKIQKVAVVAGGGNDVEFLTLMAKEGVDAFVTGITVKNDHSAKAHEFAKDNKISLLGGTHYSSEKFACIAMCDYFKKLGLDAEFVSETPKHEDF